MKAKLVIEGKEFPIEINDPELQKLLAPKKKTGYELVEDGHTYSFVNSYGEVMTLDHKDDDDDNRYCDANYYSSPTVAENNARADRLMRQLRRFAVEHREGELQWNSSVSNWNIAYCYEDKRLEADYETYWKYFGGIYFDTKEIANLAIKTFHDELIWYFTEYKDSL
jgi:hypothetical protein